MNSSPSKALHDDGDAYQDYGRMNMLPVIEESSLGAHLQFRDREVVLPRDELPPKLMPGDKLRVFVYIGPRQRIVVTRRAPLAQAGRFACLRIAGFSDDCVFLDWGMPHDLIMNREQLTTVANVGDLLPVFVKTNRTSHKTFATTELERYFKQARPPLPPTVQHDMLVIGVSELGATVVVDQRFQGLMYRNMYFEEVNVGDTFAGRVTKVRADGKVDVAPWERSQAKMSNDYDIVLDLLKKRDGYLPYSDNTDPEVIKREVGLSKKAYKRTIGTLYKQRKIMIEEKGIRLLDETPGKRG